MPIAKLQGCDLVEYDCREIIFTTPTSDTPVDATWGMTGSTWGSNAGMRNTSGKGERLSVARHKEKLYADGTNKQIEQSSKNNIQFTMTYANGLWAAMCLREWVKHHYEEMKLSDQREVYLNSSAMRFRDPSGKIRLLHPDKNVDQAFTWKCRDWWKSSEYEVTTDKRDDTARSFPWCEIVMFNNAAAAKDGNESDASCDSSATVPCCEERIDIDEKAAPAIVEPEDYVTVLDRLVIFHHTKPRANTYTPGAEWDGLLRKGRVTFGSYEHTGRVVSAKDNTDSPANLRFIPSMKWTGTTTFKLAKGITKGDLEKKRAEAKMS